MVDKQIIREANGTNECQFMGPESRCSKESQSGRTRGMTLSVFCMFTCPGGLSTEQNSKTAKESTTPNTHF